MKSLITSVCFVLATSSICVGDIPEEIWNIAQGYIPFVPMKSFLKDVAEKTDKEVKAIDSVKDMCDTLKAMRCAVETLRKFFSENRDMYECDTDILSLDPSKFPECGAIDDIMSSHKKDMSQKAGMSSEELSQEEQKALNKVKKEGLSAASQHFCEKLLEFSESILDLLPEGLNVPRVLDCLEPHADCSCLTSKQLDEFGETITVLIEDDIGKEYREAQKNLKKFLRKPTPNKSFEEYKSLVAPFLNLAKQVKAIFCWCLKMVAEEGFVPHGGMVSVPGKTEKYQFYALEDFLNGGLKKISELSKLQDFAQRKGLNEEIHLGFVQAYGSLRALLPHFHYFLKVRGSSCAFSPCRDDE